MWADATDFAFDDERFAAAFAELEDAAYAGCALSLVVTPVEGLVIDADEVPLGDGLALVRGVDARGRPARAARRRVRDRRRARARERGRRASSRPAAGCAGCRPRCGCGTTPSPRSARPRGRAPTARRGWRSRSPPGCAAATGDCLLAPEEEDPLRAFCSLVARRTPRAGELAWALRRFELGCERGTALEALTDWLLCARALLAEPDAVGYERLSERMAAICATPERARRADRRAAPRDRDGARAWSPGSCARSRPSRSWSRRSASCLRAILRDVLCGHLDPDLRRVADALLADAAPAPAS